MTVHTLDWGAASVAGARSTAIAPAPAAPVPAAPPLPPTSTLPPMMRPREIEVLLACLATLPDDAHIIEYGAGGSSVLIAQHLKPTQTLYSIEHSVEWFHKVSDAIGPQENVHLQLRERSLDVSRITIVSTPPGTPEGPITLEWCRETIEECSAGLNLYLNGTYGQDWTRVCLVLVDGLARGACLALLRQYLPSGCTVLLHDYAACEDGCQSRVEWYDWAVRLYTRVALTQTLLTLTVP